MYSVIKNISAFWNTNLSDDSRHLALQSLP